MINRDKELCVESSYTYQKDRARREAFATGTESWGPRSYFVDGMSFLGTPRWPDQPEEGYVHPVYMCYPGTLIRRDTHAVVFHQGKWYVWGNMGNPWNIDVSDFEKFK